MDIIRNIGGLKKGDYVIILESNYDHGFSGEFFNRPPETVYDGYPYEVLAVSPPFVMIRGQSEKVDAMDSRKLTLIHATKNYVKAFKESITRAKQIMGRDSKTIAIADTGNYDWSKHPRSCPECGGLLVDVLPVGGKGFTRCKDCGFEPR